MPVAIPIVEGAAEAAEGIEAAAEAAEDAYEAYRARKAAAAAAKLAAAAKAMQAAREGAQTEACSTCEPEQPKRRKNPCKHLERGSGTGKYRGGSHRQMTKPAKDGLESHHMPPADSIEGHLSRNDGAAIQMEEVDHKETLSFGSFKAAELYRDQQRELIKAGKLKTAFANDAGDVRRVAAQAGDPTRYSEAIKEAQAYADCLQQNNFTS